MLQRLNHQAHASAQASSDDFILSAMLTFSKLKLLVAELVAIETWRERLLPAVIAQLEHRGADASAVALQLYMVLFHEATLANLLEVFLYHGYAVEVRILSCARDCLHRVMNSSTVRKY